MARTLLIWLLVLALPAQAVAAVSMVHCDRNHHDAEDTSFVRLNARSEHHQSEAKSPSAQNRLAAAVPGKQEVVSSSAVGAPKPFHVGKEKCSACASCCSAAAIICASVVVPAIDVTGAAFAADLPVVDSFRADGPERPPKSLLA